MQCVLQINQSVQSFIVETFGEDKWHAVVAAAHLEAGETNWVRARTEGRAG